MTKELPIRNRVRALREQQNGMTQADLGTRIGVTRQTIAAIEQRRYSPSLESAFRIAQVFGLTVDQVFQWETNAMASSMPEGWRVTPSDPITGNE